VEQSATLERLDEQIGWYDRKSRRNQLFYKCFKSSGIVAAASIPIVALSGAPPVAAGVLGGFIAVLEALQSLNQYQSNWIGYRSTCEALKHEKYLYLAKAGDYSAASNPQGLLAERTESLVSHEHAKWVSGRQEAEKAQTSAGSRRR
jgi:hypothetical protein